MNRVAHSVVTAMILSGVSYASEDLGTISVESSTIDDKFETKKSEVSSTVVLRNEDIEKINPQNASDLLNTIPGFTISNTGTDTLKVHIRGIDNQMYMGEQPGVAIIIDGVPVQETSGKINVDLDNIESIKVIKGGASFLYGNDALSGAVIITTKRPKGVSSSKVELEAGSFGSQRFLIATNQGFENSALQLQGSYRDSDGYWDDAYTTIKSVNGKYQYYINDYSDLTFGLDVTSRKTGDGNSVSGTNEAKSDPKSKGQYSYSGYYDTDLIKTFLTYSSDIDLDSNIMLNIHKYRDDKTYKTSRFTKEKNEVWEQDGLKGEYRRSFENFAFMVGADLQNNDTDETSYDVVDGDAPRGGKDGDKLSDYKTEEDIYALYSEVRYQITRDFTATFNLRFDTLKYKYIDDSDSENSVSPDYSNISYRAGINYNLNENSSLFSSVSTGFRAPFVTQISTNSQGLKEAKESNETLNIPDDIDVEKSYNYEVGVRGKMNSISYEASIYQLDRKDYIGRIAGSYITSDDEEESYYDNVGSMRSRGFELALNSDRRKPLSFSLAYTYLDAKFTEYELSQQLTENTARYGQPSNADFRRLDLSGNSVPRTSKHNVNLTVNYQIENLTLSPELIVKSSYYADEVNNYKQDGYEVLNLRANYEVSEDFEFFGRIDNLFDTTYYQFVNISSSALATMEEDATIRVAPPRAYYAGLRYRF